MDISTKTTEQLLLDLTNIVSELIPHSKKQVLTNEIALFNGGINLNSIKMVELTMKFEKFFGIKMKPDLMRAEHFFNLKTLAEMLQENYSTAS